MALQKQSINLNFGQGIDTKTDPKQVQVGKMLSLQNAVFNRGGMLQKRNGYKMLPSLPDTNSVSLATYNGNLLAIGTSVSALNADSQQWVNSGPFQPVSLDVVPLVRRSTSQTTVDTAIASNGLSCTTWLDANGFCYYQIVDPTTGQVIIPGVQLPATAAMPRVFTVGFYFLVTFIATVAGIPHLQRIAIPINNPSAPSAAQDISTRVFSLSAAYDGVVAENNLYLSWNANDAGGAIRTTYIDQFNVQHNTVIRSGYTATRLSMTANQNDPSLQVWVTIWSSGTNNGYAFCYDQTMLVVLLPTLVISGVVVAALTSAATLSTLTVLYSVNQNYSYTPVRSDFIRKTTITSGGSVTAPVTVIRSVGIGSKAVYFPDTGRIYLLSVYGGTFQPTYFLIDTSGNVIAKLAYSNGAGYPINQILPQINVIGSTISIGYLFKALIAPVNKSQGLATAAGVYAQNGINLASFVISDSASVSAEIGSNLNLCGGFMWMYDGVKPVEQNFQVWPEDITATPSAAGGTMTAQQYFYQVTYEWTDAQGNIHRSAPSIPVGALTTTGTSSVTLNIPCLRLTYKTTPNSVRIVIYRWSNAQQIYYQITSIANPIINDPSVDSITYVDTQPDSAIIGNLILYTTGGVVENIAPPACSTMTLFKSRLVLVDSEDKNLLWYSKQVLDATPVEMSDLFTIYVAPTISAQGNTGPITALSALDDKLIIFKKNAI